MAHAELKQMPDVPELSQRLGQTITKLKDVIYPVIMECDPTMSLNALSMILIGLATCACESQSEVNQVIDMVCLGLKKNTEHEYERFISKIKDFE